MLCMENNVNYDTCRKWYDGYRLNDFEIYNPESIIRCMEDGEFDNYWCKTSSYLAIAERIRMNFEGTREAVVRTLSGEEIDVNVTSYLNTMDRFVTTDDIFTYLIHLGYLAYDEDEGTCHIPNGEIRQEWFNAIEAEDEYKETNRIIKASKELLKSTLAGDESAVTEALNASHIHVTSNRSYNNEDALQSAIYLAYIYALNDYFCFREITAGKGFADVVYIPLHAERRDKPALIIELKRNDSAESGLDQIRQKKYFDSLRQFEGELLLIGINYDEKEKTHTAKIERLEK